MKALGLLEVYSFTTAVCVGDVAAKAADVKVIAFDRNRPFNPGFPVPLIMGAKIEGNVADVSMFLRVAVTGKLNAPDLYTVMQILGQKALDRINKALETL